MSERREKRTYELSGVVQGVGFRPAVARFANLRRLTGSVRNQRGRVILVVEGEGAELDDFLADLPRQLPGPARIENVVLLSCETVEEAIAEEREFRISESQGEDDVAAVIPVDLAMCDECLSEINDPTNRRHHYPFCTCAACGPRYTIIRETPYDRERTAMSDFPMCPDCQREYDSPDDRRYHAETISCPVCGPRLTLFDAGGNAISTDNPLGDVRSALREGAIVAIRGIGGYHLAVDAFNRSAIERLRERKRRIHKSFALMAADLAVAERYCEIRETERNLLRSPRAPIVILHVKQTPLAESPLPTDLIAPDTDTLGVMLPYTPLHHLLFQSDDDTEPFSFLVMTSANVTDEPICVDDDDARGRLSGVADLFLSHDRPIEFRNEDSVCVVDGDDVQVWRRGRGYAPEAIALPFAFAETVLAMGPELKNTLALAFDETAVLSPHNGDLADVRAIADFEKVAETFLRFYQRTPDVIAVDRHPDYHSTRFGAELADRLGARLERVQHHHAHAAACMAEHGLDTALALVFDGTGLGDDESIWGAELLAVNPDGYQRLASFAPAPLPGGDAAVRRPARQLLARWLAAGVDVSPKCLTRLDVSEEEFAIWKTQVARGLNAPRTHAAGRVFDAVSTLLGLAPKEVDYEARAAISLETAARRCRETTNSTQFPYELRVEDDLTLVDWSPAFAKFADGPVDKPDAIAKTFHQAVAAAAVAMIESAPAKLACRDVVLSGGVFMNRLLSELLPPLLESRGFRVFQHRLVPPNDGGVALGQAVVAGTVANLT